MMTDFKDAKSALAEIETGVKNLATSNGWTDYLKTASRFHNYSMNNLMLISLQAPEATSVAGYKTWQSLGRQVRKGEGGIRILAPMTGKDKDTGESRVFGFRTVSVFDIAQTDGKELALSPVENLSGYAPDGIFKALTGVSKGLGFKVVMDDGWGGANGSTHWETKTIRILSANEPLMQVKTMAHELGHVTLHGPAKDDAPGEREIKELEAESVAFIVCRALGIQSDDYSFGYVLSWAGGDEQALKSLKDSASRIVRAADQIIAALNATEQSQGKVA